MKICRKCLVEKDVSFFSKHQTQCKFCYKKYYTKNKEKILESVKRNKLKIPIEIRREKHLTYFLNNKNKIYEKKREWNKNNQHKIAAYTKKYQDKLKAARLKNKKPQPYSLRENEYIKINKMVQIRVKTGAINKLPCEICGSTSKVEGHHDDYNYPLTVRWLCRKHHLEWHKINKPIYLR